VARPSAGQGVITVYGFFTPPRIAIKCFRASDIDMGETSSTMLALCRLGTSIHVLFIELA
jgi:hypothetical protein